MTVLFADIKGSFEQLAGRDPEHARVLLDPVLERMIEAVRHFGGTVNQVMGDGIMALFGAPLALEDHAARGCLSALRMQDSIKRYAAELKARLDIEVQIRVGLNTGEVVTRAMDSDVHQEYTVVGETTHLAARMEQIAEPGTIYLTEETHRLASAAVECEPLGPKRVRGLSRPVRTYVAVRQRPLEARLPRRMAPLVGREREMGATVMAMMRLQAGHGGILFVTGDAGVGKSRLVIEGLAHLSRVEVRVLEGRALSYGQQISHWPFIEMVKASAQIAEHDSPHEAWVKLQRRVGSLFGDEAGGVLPYLATFLALEVPESFQAKVRFLDAEAMGQQVFLSLRRLFQKLSEERPLLLLVEDLQWADQSSTELIEHLFPLVATHSILVCITSRPDPGGPRPGSWRWPESGTRIGSARSPWLR